MLKLLFRLILLAIVLLILVLLFAPNLISTNAGKAAFFKLYKAVKGQTITADQIKLSWWKGQDLTHVQVYNAQNKKIFEGSEISTDATLWQILFFHDLGNMQLTAPTVVINPEIAPPKPVVLQAGFVPTALLAHLPMPSLPPYLGHVIVTDGKAEFFSPGLDPIELQDVALDLTLLKSQIKAKGTGSTSQGDIKGKFDVALNVQSGGQIDLTADLQNFPVRSLDQILALSQPTLKGALIEAIGTAMSVQLKLKNLPDVLEVYCDASSPSFSAHIETATQDGAVTLASPALIQFQVPPPFVKKFTGLTINNPFQGQLKIDGLSMPLDDKESFSFQATLKSESLEFPFGTVQPFAIFASTTNFKERRFTLKADSPQIQLNSDLYLPQDWEQLTLTGQAMLPHNTRVDFTAQTIGALTATVQGDEWQGSFWGGYDPRQHVIFLTKPAQIVYRLAQLPAPLPALLNEPLPVRVEIDPFRLSLADISGTVTLRISTDPFSLSNIPVGATQITAKGDLKTRQATFQLNSTLNQGLVTASGSYISPENFTVKANLAQVPTSSVDIFLKSGQQLSPIVGPLLNVTLDLVNLPQKRQMSVQAASDQLLLQASLEQNGQTMQLTKPAQLSLKLTPEGYAAIDRWLNQTPTPFMLSQPASIKASIALLQLPLNFKDVSEISYQADLSIDTLAFAGKNSAQNNAQSNARSSQLNQVQLHLEHKGQSSPVLFKLAATGAPEGTVSVQGSLDKAAGSIQLTGRLEQFPTNILDAIARAAGKTDFSLATLFGPQLNLSAQASLTNLSGPVQFQLNSPNIRASLNGALNQGILTLSDTFHLQMSLDPDVSRMLLKSLNPLSVSAVTSEGPITLVIPPQGFSYPLFPENDSKMNIPSGRLELGKIYAHNEGNLNVALGLLKLSQFSQNQDLELWFAPLDFHIKNGQMDCERTEILVAGAYQICLWGDVDFVQQQVDMILGLTASCLSKAFGIKNLPEQYVLQIPMRGPFNDVKINTSKATTKVGALLLWQQGTANIPNAGGTAGSILGGLMKKIGPLPDGNSKAPPPKRPFPWEQNAPAKKKKTAEAEPVKKKKLVNPDEQALKQALKLLR